MPNALTNRRHITAAREPSPPPAPADNSGNILAELQIITGLLAKLNRDDRAELAQLCITDREPAQQRLANFPVNGVHRFIVRRTGQGGTFACPTTTPVLVATATEARLGGSIVNSGAGAVTLILTSDIVEPGTTTPLSVGVPQIWLAANGGAWDFLNSGTVWGGNVVAYATTTSQVTVAEF